MYIVAASRIHEPSLRRFLEMYTSSPCEKLTNADDVALLVGRADASWDILK